MVSSPPLPLDLLRPILSHIADTETLFYLCLISKTCLHDAQQRLWGDVSLRSAAVASFCRTVSAAPALGRAVRRLSLQLANELPASELDGVAHALHLLPNLNALEITPPQAHRWADFVTYPASRWLHDDTARILHGAPFRVMLFRSAFKFAHADLIQFLREQDGIEELVSFDFAREAVRLKGEMLPRLKRFWSPLQRLEFDQVEGDGDRGGADGVEAKGKRVFYQGRMDIVLSARGLEDI
ncbi:hypothetical protein DFH06DRAFT_355357 [Mycena polygramma]|nr:hypothetical protein DFH06DRAFT_355357 [Mycena polygramma]